MQWDAATAGRWRSPKAAGDTQRTIRPLISTLDELLGRGIAAWVGHVTRHARATAIGLLCLSGLLLFYSLDGLEVNTNENDLFSDDLPFYTLREDFNRAFPSTVDPLLVVVDGATVDLAHEAARTLARRLEEQPAHFHRVEQPDSGPFFDRHAFLYLDLNELEDLVDNLFTVQPYLAELSRDASLRGFLHMLSQAVDASVAGDLEGVNLEDVINRLGDVAHSHLDGEGYQLSWADVITGRDSTPRDRRRFLLVEPVVDFSQLSPAEQSLLALRATIDELGFNSGDGVVVRATGVFPLSYEEMEHLDRHTARAGIASFVMVGLILGFGLGSLRLVFASLVTLLAGLAATAAFAALAIGHLNLISVAFAVLFIGLSIDFAIHLCVRLREEMQRYTDTRAALCAAAESVGGSLVLCATTTAIAFLSFLPTDYVGVAELGSIAGAGMFVSLFTNLTLLPALIAWWVPTGSLPPPPASSEALRKLLALPVQHARAVVAAALLCTGIAVWSIPQIRFDPNPLRVRDPSTTSVRLFDEMLEAGDALPWNLNALAADAATARSLAERIEALPDVDKALTLDDYVPDQQEEKLALLEEAAFVLLPTLEAQRSRGRPSTGAQLAAVAELQASLEVLPKSDASPRLIESAGRLHDSLQRLRERWSSTPEGAASLADFESSLIGSLPEQLRVLQEALQPTSVTRESLPESVMTRMTASDGRSRVEIFPEKNLNDPDALENYVRSVQGLAPKAFGEGLVILETGAVVVGALRQALVVAALLISVLLLCLWRDVGDALLVVAPLGLATLFTAATSVPLGVPFNFANVIVIPLLLGMGVDTGIHLVHRYRSEALPGGNLLRTGTARAVLLSSLTTVASFGTLGISTHLGMASLGQLLALGIALILLCNLVVLPALLQVTGRAR